MGIAAAAAVIAAAADSVIAAVKGVGSLRCLIPTPLGSAVATLRGRMRDPGAVRAQRGAAQYAWRVLARLLARAKESL
jgi:transposase